MLSFTLRTKPALLTCAMIISTSSSCFELSNPKALSVVAAMFGTVALKVRLDTKPRGTYNYSDWQTDAQNLLGAFNIFDAESRATIMNFIDKYFVGAKFKLDDQMIRVKEEDGAVVTTKRKKVTQLPSGLMGLFDAYVLQQLEINSKLIPVAAVMYLLITNPEGSWNNAIKAASGAKDVNVMGKA